MFRIAILAGLILAFAFAVFGGTFAGYAATQKSPQGNILASAVAGTILCGAFGFAAGATVAPLGLAAFQWLQSNRPRFRLRTLLIVLAILPPMLAAVVPPIVAWLSQPAPLAEKKDSAMQAIADYEWKLRVDRSKALIPYVPKSK